MKKITNAILFILISLIGFGLSEGRCIAEQESSIPFELSTDTGYDLSAIMDANYTSMVEFPENSHLVLKSSENIQALYIEWFTVPVSYEYSYNGQTFKGGENGFYHEFLALDGDVREVDFHFLTACQMCDIYAFGDGEIPATVQRWEPMCDKADMLIISTHADDEVLFLGGAAVEYGGERDLDVQVLYFYEYRYTWAVRDHERLDGLWAMGIKHYPDTGVFKEATVYSMQECRDHYDYPNALGWMVEKIRKYKPLVCVTQDVNGEYGNLHHLMLVNMVMDAVNISGDSEQYPESAETYGAYEVPKTYLHLWAENKIQLDTRKPLDAFGGKTAFDVATEAYKKHVSQQEYWFYVSDDNQYSIRDFGLYRTNVGIDTTSDMMENVVSYEEQERIIQESIEAESEQESILAAESEQESILAAENDKTSEAMTEESAKTTGNNRPTISRNTKLILAILGILAGILIVAIIILIIIRSRKGVK